MAPDGDLVLPIDAFRESVTTIQGRTLSWLDWGAEHHNDPPVVCLHGAMGSGHLWDQFAAELATTRRVIAPDFRGHGDSGWVTPPNYALRDYRADVEALLEALEIKRFALVGHSMGGLVALMLAGTQPRDVCKLVVVDIEAKPPDSQIDHLRAVGERGHRVLPDFESTTEAARRSLPDVDEEIVSWILPYAFKRVGGGHIPKWDPATLAKLERWNVEPWLARVRCPSLLVRGGESHVMRAEVAESMAGVLDDCVLETIAGAGHQVMLQQPELFVEVVLPFLADAAPGE